MLTLAGQHAAMTRACTYLDLCLDVVPLQLAVLVMYLKRRHKQAPTRWPKLHNELTKRGWKAPM